MSRVMKELLELGSEDLHSRIVELKKGLLRDRVQVSTGVSPKSAGTIKRSKKTIARILMIIRRREQEKA